MNTAARLLSSLRPLLGNGRFFLPLLLILFALSMASYLLVWGVDPYDLRAGGMKVRLSERPYKDRYTPRVTLAVAKGAHDLVVVGGSTALGYSPAMLRAAFPEARNPANISFSAIKPSDFGNILERLARNDAVKRVILSAEFTFIRTPPWMIGYDTARYFEPARWNNPAPEFEVEAIGVALNVAARGTLSAPGWHRKDPERPDFMVSGTPITADAKRLAKIRLAVEATRAQVARAPLTPCADLPAFRERVLPALRQLSARGAVVDVLMPPYAASVYADWEANYPPGHFFRGQDAVWANLTGLKYCILEAVQGLAGVSVHGFDDLSALTHDLSRYQDSGHVYDPAAYPDLLARIAGRRNVLTLAGWPDYERRLREGVRAFAP